MKKKSSKKKNPLPIKAYEDLNFIKMDRQELRAVRIQLELLKPSIAMDELGIRSTIVIFGSARTLPADVAKKGLVKAERAYKKNTKSKTLKEKLRKAKINVKTSKYYEEARLLAEIVSEADSPLDNVICTGGGPGIMEAGNRGAKDAGGLSIGLNISLPFEQEPNPYITPDLNFQFHYFSIRKMHFLMKANALVAMPGGWGTMDELFECLTLIQTQKLEPIPVVLIGKDFWKKLIDWKVFIDYGMISPDDVKYYKIVDTAQEAWKYIEKFHADKNKGKKC